MSKALDRNLECYKIRQLVECDLDERNFEKDPNCSEAPKEIVDAVAKLVVDGLSAFEVFKNLPTPIRYFKCSINVLIMWDKASGILYTDENLKNLKQIKKVLDGEKSFVEVYNLDKLLAGQESIRKYKLDQRSFNKKDKEKLLRYYFGNYGDMKKISKEIDSELNKIDDKLAKIEIENIQDNRIDLEKKRDSLINGRLALIQLRENVILTESVNINKSNKNSALIKFCTSLMNFAADIITLVTFPVIKGMLFAIQLPAVIVKVFLKLAKIISKRVNKEKINEKDDEELFTAGLQIPSLFKALWDVLDKYIFKKFREKAEESRKENRFREQLKFLKKRISENEILAEEIEALEKEILAKKIETLEKETDPSIMEAVRISKQTKEVLNARPDKWWLRLNFFKMRTLEDNERIENTAKFVVKHVKELYLSEERLKEIDLEEQDKDHISKQLELSYARMRFLIKTLGIKKDEVDKFIDDVKDYKRKKDEDIRKAGGKENMSNVSRDAFKANKNDLVERLVKAMKSEEEGD